MRYPIDFDVLEKKIGHAAVEKARGNKIDFLVKSGYSTYYRDKKLGSIQMKNLIKLQNAGVDVDGIIKKKE